MSRRSSCSLGPLLGVITRREAERIAGKIRASGGYGWKLGDEPAVNPQGVVFKPIMDQLGRMTTLAKGRYVSNCPEAPEEAIATAPFMRGGFSVWEPICKRCPHRLPHSCCELLQLRAKSDKGFTAQDAIAEAQKRVEDLLK